MLLSLYRSCLWYVLERKQAYSFFFTLRSLAGPFLVLNVNRMSCCQCDCSYQSVRREKREKRWIGNCKFAHNLIWVEWMDWLPVRPLSETPAFIFSFIFLYMPLPPSFLDFISSLQMQCTPFNFILVFFVWFVFSERFFKKKKLKWGGKKKTTEEIDPQMVPAKDLYLFCTCIVFRDVFNYFGCWNKACLCGQLDAGYVIFLSWPQCLSLSRN